MAWRERSKNVCFGAAEGQPFIPICRLSHVTSIRRPGWDLSLERGLTPRLACMPELRATAILLHQQPGKCQSEMREESRSLKWQDWRFPSPLTVGMGSIANCSHPASIGYLPWYDLTNYGMTADEGSQWAAVLTPGWSKTIFNVNQQIWTSQSDWQCEQFY